MLTSSPHGKKKHLHLCLIVSTLSLAIDLPTYLPTVSQIKGEGRLLLE